MGWGGRCEGVGDGVDGRWGGVGDVVGWEMRWMGWMGWMWVWV